VGRAGVNHVEVSNACEFVEDSANDCLDIVKALKGPYTRSQVRDWMVRLSNAAQVLDDAAYELAHLR
jgi:hypothetical protein